METQIFHHARIQSSKNPLKETMVPRLCYDHTLHYVILFCEHEKNQLPILKHAENLFIFIGITFKFI
jgi:hypothetical protein